MKTSGRYQRDAALMVPMTIDQHGNNHRADGQFAQKQNSAPAEELHEAEGSFEDGDRECARCGDEVATLSSRDWCDGCEARADEPACDECGAHDGEDDPAGQPAELNHWPNLKRPVTLCASCTYNAYRSGWVPGQ